MNIGIITFHWAANHGAILQAYALCRFLKQKYQANVQIIDYYPKHMEHTLFNALRRLRPSAILQGIREVKKDKCLKEFREKLPLTTRFYSNKQLIDEGLKMDVLITGSDQIWNPSFLRYGEEGGAPVYYLNFGDGKAKKLAVSASFGCKTFPDDCKSIVKQLLDQFAGIGVRENTGIEILRSFDIQGGVVTADPTALLSGDEYINISSKCPSIPANSVTKMILRRQSKKNKELISKVSSKFSNGRIFDLEFLSMQEWLAAIKNSKIVITNSFHCVMMCLKLHTPFVVILEDGLSSGMNDRFMTLLDRFGLTDRVIKSEDDLINISKDIDFKQADLNMELYAETLTSFLERNISK